MHMYSLYSLFINAVVWFIVGTVALNAWKALKDINDKRKNQ